MKKTMMTAVLAGMMSMPLVAFGDDAAQTPTAPTATTAGAPATTTSATTPAKAPATPWWATDHFKKNWGEWVEKFAAAHAKLVAAQNAVKDAQGAVKAEKDKAKRKELQLQVAAARKAEITVRIEWYQLHVTFREAQHKKAVENYEKEVKTRAEQIKKLQDQLANIK